MVLLRQIAQISQALSHLRMWNTASCLAFTWVPRLTTYPFPFQVSAAFVVVVGQLVGFCFVLFFDFQNFSLMVENNDNMV